MTNMIGPYRLDTIVCSNCLDVMKQMPDGCIDLVVTSPPYPMASMWTQAELPDFALVWNAVTRVMKPISSAIVVVNDAQVDGMSFFDWQTAQHCQQAGLRPRTRFIWHKTGWKPFGRYAIDPRHEYILWFSRGNPQLRSLTDKPIKTSTVWAFKRYESNQPKREGSSWHKAPFCLALAEYAVELLSDPGNLVFDPFLGSGTTAVAAKKLGRHYFGCDISQEYVDMANRRIAKITGVQLALPERKVAVAREKLPL